MYIDEASNLCKKSQRRLIKLLTENRFTRVNGKFSVEVDVRIITATSKNIQEMIKNNSFSEDLFYRLNVVPIKVPSLKERIEDIPDIIEYFLRSCSKDLGLAYRKLSREHYSLLQSMNLVGNLRQLKNIIENLLIIGQANNDEEISEIILSYNKNYQENFSEVVQNKLISLTLKKARELFEKEYINLQMKRFNNNVSKTADFIGMERSALHRKLNLLNNKSEK